MRAGPYAWPGGYPCFLVTGDGESMSFEGARELFGAIAANYLSGDPGADEQWQIIGCQINWEDTDLRCADTGKTIPAAHSA